MKQVTKISLAELKKMAEKMYESIVKADVDIVKKIMLVDMVFHADGEAYLMERGSKQNDLWGINLHPNKYGTDEFIEFDSIINIRQGNKSKNVQNETTRTEIIELINEIVHE